MKNYINWRIFFILLGLCLASIAAVFPYVLTLQGELFEQVGIAVSTIVLAQFVQGAILFSLLIFLGLRLAERTGFRLPLLEALTQGRDYKAILKSVLGLSVALGIAVALAIYFLDPLFTALGASITTHQNLAPAWQKLLAALYGGVTEEVFMRLFLMTLLVWVGMKISRKERPTRAGVVLPIVLAAVAFGLGHLPVTAALTQVTPSVVIRAIVLNGIGGIAFGWLYWKRGLESAMIAHFTTDIFLLTLLPLI